MEIEVILQFVLVFALGLCVGLPFSSRLGTKHLKEHVRFLEGKINRARQDKKDDGGGGLMSLLSGGLDEKSIMKFLSNLKPEHIQQGMDYLNKAKGGDQNTEGVNTWR